TGGSVRLPAAACGCFGLLATNGRISRFGMLPLSHSLDNPGPLTRSARDAARILAVIAGRDSRDPSSSRQAVDNSEAQIGGGVRGLRIGVPKSYYRDEADADTGMALDESARILASLGATIVPIEVPDPRPLDALGNILILSEAASYHAKDLAER